MTPRLLVTNDDGVWAPGLHALAGALARAGHQLMVAAPLDDRSGSGAGIGRLHADETIDVRPVDLPGLDGAVCYGVDGPPALAVMTAHLGGFGDRPDVVVSGINPGINTGRSTLFSGTVGAALAGASFGLSGLAVSLGVGEPCHWETAATLAVTALDWLSGEPPGTVLNLNVPNVALAELRGVRWGTLASFGTVRAAMVESQGGLQMELAEHQEELPPGSDTALVLAGYASVTSIRGITATEEVDAAAFIADGVGRRSA